jgi:hypothetical protein
MNRHLCVEVRLSALSAPILTSNGLIDRLDFIFSQILVEKGFSVSREAID